MTINSRARVALAAAMALGGSAFGQTLAERVPADSVVYFGWRGTADPGPGYAGSRWAAALKESNFAKFVDDTLPAAATVAQRKWPEHGPLLQAVVNAARIVIKRPVAAFLVYSNGPQWGVFCRPEKDSPALQAAFKQIAGVVPMPARVVTTDADVGLVFGYDGDAPITGGLDGGERFKNALKHVVADPTSVFYLDVEKARKAITDTVAKNSSPDIVERVEKFIAASGLGGVNAYVAADGFAGRDWVSEGFLDAPMPRKGLLANSPETAIDPALVKRIPASANTARVFHFDAATLLNDAREITSAVDPQARDMLEKVIGASKLAVGRDLTADLLPSLGTQWAAYTSSDVGGTGSTGMVLVNRLKNPAKAKQAMVSLSLFLSNSGRNLVPDKNVTLGGRMTKVGDLQVYYAATPLVAPAWTIKDDCLYLGFYPQPVIEAARYGGASIDTVPAFAELMKPKDGAQPLAVSYTDVLRMMDDGYSSTLAASRLLFGLGDVYLAPTPEPLLPSLPALRAEATPATTTIWSDDAGLHIRARSPFPGAETMATFQVANVYAAPMAISVLLPSLNRAREAANRVKSASNLRMIGLASMMCANEDRQGKFPSDVSEIFRRQEIPTDAFVNPRRGDHGRPDLPPDQDPKVFYAGWLTEQTDYVYVGKGKTMSDNADGILAYENPTGLDDGINVLFVDCHVEFVAFGQLDAVFGKAGIAPPAR